MFTMLTVASPRAASAIHHDSRSATHLQRTTHDPKLHRAATGERCHRRHASSTSNHAQDNQVHDTKCWDKPRTTSLSHSLEHRWKKRDRDISGAHTPHDTNDLTLLGTYPVLATHRRAYNEYTEGFLYPSYTHQHTHIHTHSHGPATTPATNPCMHHHTRPLTQLTCLAHTH